MTSQIMYDMTGNNVHRLVIPHTPYAIGGYVNGSVGEFVWTEDQWDSFPDSYHVHINVTGELGVGNCLDIENGDAGVSNIVPWVNSQFHIDDPLLLYCNRDNEEEVVAARQLVKHWQGKVFIWIATLDGTVIGNRSMTQFGQFRDSAGAYADVSIIINPTLIHAMGTLIGQQKL